MQIREICRNWNPFSALLVRNLNCRSSSNVYFLSIVIKSHELKIPFPILISSKVVYDIRPDLLLDDSEEFIRNIDINIVQDSFRTIQFCRESST